MMEPQETVLVECQDRITTITLNRPEKHNTYTGEMMRRIFDEIHFADANDEVGCIVVRGAGPSFSLGFDLDGALSARGEGDPAALRELQAPVIAQLHGYCVAGALDFATSCDFLVVADDAKIRYPIVKTIASPPTHMFTYLMGTQWTRYLLYTGNLIDGKRAAEVGLVLFSVPVGELEGAVRRLASDVASTPMDLLAILKSVSEKALDLMGRPLVKRLAIEADFMAHRSPKMKEFYEVGKQKGYEAAYDHLAGS
jgi:enoyl-CoA hydratase